VRKGATGPFAVLNIRRRQEKVLSTITIPWRHPVKSACKENGTYLGPLSDFGD